MSVAFEVSEWFAATPEEVYDAWLTSDEHSRMTGSPARVSNRIGEDFQAWDGYIKGRNVELERPRRIVQHWRTTEFAESDPDSLLEVLLAVENGGTRVTIRHSGLPEHGMQYREGWIEAYFMPMKEYFEHKRAGGGV